MAEKYGTIPEKFTKAWWAYYWEYYRWYVIVPLVIIIAIGATIYSKVTEEKFDTTLIYAANKPVFQTSVMMLMRMVKIHWSSFSIG